jgi:hypothetical protein
MRGQAIARVGRAIAGDMAAAGRLDISMVAGRLRSTRPGCWDGPAGDAEYTPADGSPRRTPAPASSEGVRAK